MDQEENYSISKVEVKIFGELQYKDDNPGSVRFGNFINYYTFHPPEERIKLLPTNIWDNQKDKKLVLLDLGCNAGNLTNSIHNLFCNSISKDTKIYGVDIDPMLVSRAKERYSSTQIFFETLDIMNDKKTLEEFLKSNAVEKFTTSFCFSVTMWIHLNHGDDGLKNFLKRLSKISQILVIEAQPWKCYKSAVKRVKGAKEEFPLFKDLKIRKNVEDVIEKYLINHCHMTKIVESDRSKWNRKLLFFKSS